MFDKDKILENMEALRRPNGAFIAAPTPDYSAMWIRDHLYCTCAYWYLGDYEKLKQGIWLIFDLFKKHRRKIEARIASPLEMPGAIIHAKYHPDTLEEITLDHEWGHDQLDAIGLFLHIVADLDFKHMRLIRDESDLEILKLLVFYLRSIEYWQRHDKGMWEECAILHSSSVGAVVKGLRYVKERRLVDVPDTLIRLGDEALGMLLPFESRPCSCGLCARHSHEQKHHNHDCDAAQLSLIWPYNIIVNPERQDEVLTRITEGHAADNGDTHHLVQRHGLNRYWGDDYYRSREGGPYRGISAEWPVFDFWISVICSQRHEYEKAREWFEKGRKGIVRNRISEAFQNGRPNDHTPFAWGHAIALIAFSKLPQDAQDALFPKKTLSLDQRASTESDKGNTQE